MTEQTWLEIRIVSDGGAAETERIMAAIKPDLARAPFVQQAKFAGEEAPPGAMGFEEITAGAVLLNLGTVAVDHAVGAAFAWLKQRFSWPGAPSAGLEIKRPDGTTITIDNPASLTPEQIAAYVKALSPQSE